MKRNWFHRLREALTLFRGELALFALRIWYWPARPPTN